MTTYNNFLVNVNFIDTENSSENLKYIITDNKVRFEEHIAIIVLRQDKSQPSIYDANFINSLEEKSKTNSERVLTLQRHKVKMYVLNMKTKSPRYVTGKRLKIII